MITGVLLNWKRPDNVRRIVSGWQASGIVNESRVWNNNRDSRLSLDNALVVNTSVDMGLYTRFLAATAAQNECVLIQDDDLELPRETLEKLYSAWIAEPDRLHGIFGRRPKRDGTYADNVIGNHDVPIVLTRALLMHRKYAAEFFRHLPAFDAIQIDSKPFGNGEDIIMNYVVRSISGKLNRVHQLKVNELAAPHSIHGRPGHYQHRTKLMQFCERWLANQSAPPKEPPKMKVAAICCTYKRPAELAEAIECFLRQDYPAELREMIVLDDAGQYAPNALVGIPGVKLVTTSHRFRTMGEKRNASAALVSPDVDAYAVWDDDDIYLPWHISAGVRALADAEYTIPKLIYTDKANNIEIKENQYLFHGAWMFRRSAFEKVGGYPWIQSGQDKGLLERLKAASMRRANPIEFDNRPSYVYRWYTTPSKDHLSAKPGQYESFAKKQFEHVDKIEPRWDKTWVSLTEKVMVAS